MLTDPTFALVQTSMSAPATKKPRTDEMPLTQDTMLWHVTHDFCADWKAKNDALGARNVMAAFFLLAQCASNSLEFFPDKKDWFSYVGRFLALYVRDEDTETDNELRLNPTLEANMDVLDGVTIRTLASSGNPTSWAKMINDDCSDATQKKITEIVGPEDVDDPRVQMVVLAAEFIKGKWLNPFSGITYKGTPFYGTGAGVAPGECCMMQYEGIDDAGGGLLLWEGKSCQVVFLPTLTMDDKPTTTYGVVVLPHGQVDTPTDPEQMDAAAKEIKDRLEDLQNFVRLKKRKCALLQMPRMKRAMAPVDLTRTCANIMPEPLMQQITGVVEVDHKVKGWTDSPMRVGKVSHATYLEVHETGFEAAAATGIVCYRALGAVEEQPHIVRCNRGYLFYLMDMGPQPHVLYYARVETDEGLKDAPAAPDFKNEKDLNAKAEEDEEE
jgi:hypothetical protein